jgi:hypothetical protein
MARLVLRAVIRWALAPTPAEAQAARAWLAAKRREALVLLPTLSQRRAESRSDA